MMLKDYASGRSLISLINTHVAGPQLQQEFLAAAELLAKQAKDNITSVSDDHDKLTMAESTAVEVTFPQLNCLIPRCVRRKQVTGQAFHHHLKARIDPQLPKARGNMQARIFTQKSTAANKPMGSVSGCLLASARWMHGVYYSPLKSILAFLHGVSLFMIVSVWGRRMLGSGMRSDCNVELSVICAHRGKFNLALMAGQLLLGSDKRDIVIPTSSILGVVVSCSRVEHSAYDLAPCRLSLICFSPPGWQVTQQAACCSASCPGPCQGDSHSTMTMLLLTLRTAGSMPQPLAACVSPRCKAHVLSKLDVL